MLRGEVAEEEVDEDEGRDAANTDLHHLKLNESQSEASVEPTKYCKPSVYLFPNVPSIVIDVLSRT